MSSSAASAGGSALAHLGGGGDGVVASLQPRQQLAQVVDGRLEGRQVLQDGQDVPARVQHPALVEGLGGAEQERGRDLAQACSHTERLVRP